LKIGTLLSCIVTKVRADFGLRRRSRSFGTNRTYFASRISGNPPVAVVLHWQRHCHWQCFKKCGRGLRTARVKGDKA
jgi:hypothetical protein